MTYHIVNGKVGEGVKFERLRRVTGYLTGSTEKWNDAKQCEERDRLKHDTTGYRKYFL